MFRTPKWKTFFLAQMVFLFISQGTERDCSFLIGLAGLPEGSSQ